MLQVGRSLGNPRLFLSKMSFLSRFLLAVGLSIDVLEFIDFLKLIDRRMGLFLTRTGEIARTRFSLSLFAGFE